MTHPRRRHRTVAAEAEAEALRDSCRCSCSDSRNSCALAADRLLGARETAMDYPSRPRKRKQRAPDDDVGSDCPKLRLAEYSAPFGEEMPSRTATSDCLELAESWSNLRPERGRLH